jgi:hypothetical protein
MRGSYLTFFAFVDQLKSNTFFKEHHGPPFDLREYNEEICKKRGQRKNGYDDEVASLSFKPLGENITLPDAKPWRGCHFPTA